MGASSLEYLAYHNFRNDCNGQVAERATRKLSRNGNIGNNRITEITILILQNSLLLARAGTLKVPKDRTLKSGRKMGWYLTISDLPKSNRRVKINE